MMLVKVMFFNGDISGADPTIENANGHKAVLYVQNPETKKLLMDAEKKVKK